MPKERLALASLVTRRCWTVFHEIGLKQQPVKCTHLNCPNRAIGHIEDTGTAMGAADGALGVRRGSIWKSMISIHGKLKITRTRSHGQAVLNNQPKTKWYHHSNLYTCLPEIVSKISSLRQKRRSNPLYSAWIIREMVTKWSVQLAMGPITPKELHFVISISLISILSKEVKCPKYHFSHFYPQ